MSGKQKNMSSIVEILKIFLTICKKLMITANDGTCYQNQLQLKECL